MIVVYQNQFHLCQNSIVALGTFDGVHLGHQAVIKQTVQMVKKVGCSSVVITFDPHPQQVASIDKKVFLLTTIEERYKRINLLGVDFLAINQFDTNLAQLEPSDFVKEILVGWLKVKGVVVGYDYAFGYRRSGRTSDLRELATQYGFLVEVVSPVYVEGNPETSSGQVLVKSSLIRSLISGGEISKANKLLGYGYTIIGQVIEGKKRGRKIGFPTANISFTLDKLKPATGVYLVEIFFREKSFYGLANFGQCPTFGPVFNTGQDKSLEVLILDFKGNLYDQKLEIIFKEKIRDEMVFSHPDHLKKQIELDINWVRKYLSHQTRHP